MTDETELVTEADPVQRVAMRADLLEIPLPATISVRDVAARPTQRPR